MFKEPQNATEYQLIIDRYYSCIYSGDSDDDMRGAILMGVCRGRISEGLDFSDNAARLVLVVGIPNPQVTDPKVILKQQYLDEKARKPL